MHRLMRLAGVLLLLAIVIAFARENSVASENDCCCNCEGSNLCTQRRHPGARADGDALERFDGRSEPRLNITDTTGEDPKCNNELLRKIIRRQLTFDMHTSKRAIHLEAELEMGNKFAVVCAEATFSYLATTGTYCQDGNERIKCYAFQYA